jgi:hypothetical protein
VCIYTNVPRFKFPLFLFPTPHSTSTSKAMYIWKIIFLHSFWHLKLSTMLQESWEKSGKVENNELLFMQSSLASQHSFSTLHFSTLTFCPIWMINGLFGWHPPSLKLMPWQIVWLLPKKMYNLSGQVKGLHSTNSDVYSYVCSIRQWIIINEIDFFCRRCVSLRLLCVTP